MNELTKTNQKIKNIAESLKNKVINWKTLTLDIVQGLYQAKQLYSNQGLRTDISYLNDNDTSTSFQNETKLKTFKHFCMYIGLSKTTVWRYLERYEPDNNKLLTPEQLEEKKQIEYQSKLSKQQKKKELIYKRYQKKGEKPIGWIDEYENDYQKYYQEQKDRDERIKKLKEKTKIEQENHEKIKEERKIEDDFIQGAYEALNERIEKQKEFKKKFESTIENQDDFLMSLDEVISGLDNDNRRLEFLHNIIKFCKVRINEFQVKSIQRN